MRRLITITISLFFITGTNIYAIDSDAVNELPMKVEVQSHFALCDELSYRAVNRSNITAIQAIRRDVYKCQTAPELQKCVDKLSEVAFTDGYHPIDRDIWSIAWTEIGMLAARLSVSDRIADNLPENLVKYVIFGSAIYNYISQNPGSYSCSYISLPQMYQICAIANLDNPFSRTNCNGLDIPLIATEALLQAQEQQHGKTQQFHTVEQIAQVALDPTKAQDEVAEELFVLGHKYSTLYDLIENGFYYLTMRHPKYRDALYYTNNRTAENAIADLSKWLCDILIALNPDIEVVPEGTPGAVCIDGVVNEAASNFDKMPGMLEFGSSIAQNSQIQANRKYVEKNRQVAIILITFRIKSINRNLAMKLLIYFL